MPHKGPIIFPLGGYIPVKDVNCFDEEQKIWSGEIVAFPGMQYPFRFIFFSREYQPEVNELDQIIKEKAFSDKLLGFEFILVPKEKLFFGHQPEGTILMPSVEMLGKKKRLQ